MDLKEYYSKYGYLITQESEKLFIDEFMYPILGSQIEHVIPQYPFLDSTGRNRRIDFAYIGKTNRLALEVNGETYHAEGIIPGDMFDDNLFRQNEILQNGYKLLRFSYNQLQSPNWRPIVTDTLRSFIRQYAPELLSEHVLRPLPIQEEVLNAIDFFRNHRGWRKGIVVLPTGTGKTILSALDAKQHGGKVLFLVHRLDILKQSIEAYRTVWPEMVPGILTGEVKEKEKDCDVLFASKDTLRKAAELTRFGRRWFDYIIVDEVHHGQSPTYKEVLSYFSPRFMLGMTATPDRTDRRDIFELFDYNKIFEMSAQEAIERGFLVPFTYYGLTDNIDYSRIRYENNKYRVDDLERHLIIPKRNQAILNKYNELGRGDKAIGFCVSINHANRMAQVFNENGITSAAIHSASPGREELLSDFRENKIQVVFTIDLFNEGMDFPNVRVLLFLRPTESKTVFLQQLGRGLRLCSGKDRVRVLDFIGNYKRANQIRKYLAKSSAEIEVEENGRRRRKIIYEYSPGCEVFFDSTVEEILNRQDAEELGVTKADLKEAYYAMAEGLGRKPTRSEIDSGEYKSSVYARVFGSWLSFLREIGEYTEASYHYPQGTHLGHILSVLYYFGSGNRLNSHFDDQFVRIRGGLGEGRLSTYRRQVKYKLQAAMELGILTDDRNYSNEETNPLELTAQGKELYLALKSVLSTFDLSFPLDENGIPSTRMRNTEAEYNAALREFINLNDAGKTVVLNVFLRMHAVQQMLAFLYHICRKSVVPRREIYEQFFQAPFVRQYCEEEGIEETTLEASKRRCPFLLNILDACDIIDSNRESITVKKLVIMPSLVRAHRREDEALTLQRVHALAKVWPSSVDKLSSEDYSILAELFGASFLSDTYFLKELFILGDK